MSPSLFDFNGAAVRVVHNESGIWFVASDVCRVLEIGNTSMAMARLDEEDKGIISTDTPGGQQEVLCANESGLYALILGSRKPEAKAFKRWVTSEVLPTIRKTGAYAAPGLIPTNRVPQSFAEALRLAADAEEAREAARRELADAAPKLKVYDAVMSSTSLFTFREVAAMIPAANMGSNLLVKRLMAERILFRDAKGHVCAYRERIDAGYFRGIETPYTHPESGEVRVSCQIKVTPAGVEFIAKRLGVAVVPQEMEVAS